MSLSSLLAQAYPIFEARIKGQPSARSILFFSLSDGKTRARVFRGAGKSFRQAWQDGVARCQRETQRSKQSVRWLRIDRVIETYDTTWGDFVKRMSLTKRNYFRLGLALDVELQYAFLEQELNANAMLYLGADKTEAGLNEKNFTAYAKWRFGENVELDFSEARSVHVFSHDGLFLAEDAALESLPGGSAPIWLPGADKPSTRWRSATSLNAGRRQFRTLDQVHVYSLVDSSAQFLARQVKTDGRFVYGHFPCFGREIPTYNALRHASSVYSMLEAWELTRNDTLMASIRRAIAYLTDTLIRCYPQSDGTVLAYNVDVNGEIKLGANAVSLLALVKYDELTGDTQHRTLMDQLALGIARMQNPDSGSFVHVLNAQDLSLKDAFRIVYYDGEAAFGLMRLYGLTLEPRWLTVVEKAFEYFIGAEHWKHHDHWLSYCANELTLYRPEEKYFRFGVKNVSGFLDFVLKRETTYPTLLELCMAFEAMLRRIETSHPEMLHVLEGFDKPEFYRALNHRAHYLLNGFFWPELAMYFAKPSTIVGSFFIRHHAFRVRIDDIEHYLSGYVAYWKMLGRNGENSYQFTSHAGADSAAGRSAGAGPSGNAVVMWGGDVNLGRRQHYRAAELGLENILRIPALKEADLRVVNLECVIATKGEQGHVQKGEGGPYFYRARPEMLQVLIAAGIDVVATANNHSGDYGAEALLEQSRWLDAAAIAHAGSGPHREAAFAPTIRRAGDLNVAIFSVDATQQRFSATHCSPGNAYLPLKGWSTWVAEMSPRIAAARNQAHVVLVAVHWGENFSASPEADQIAAGRCLIDAGADAVLGSSAHVLQGIEIYRDRPIIHDAGDLLFDAVRNDLGNGGVFKLQLTHAGVTRIVFIPVGTGFGFAEQLTGPAAKEVSSKYSETCATLGSRLHLTDHGSAYVDLSPPPREWVNLTPAPAGGLNKTRLAGMTNVDLYDVATWEVESVPQEAVIAPLKFGPLTLLGIRIQPQGPFTRRRMLWVESFWQCDVTPQENIRLNIRAVPTGPTAMRAWGRGMDHDPGDWMAPTSRWKAGAIYRDFYGLRPPYLKEWENAELQLTVDIVSDRYASAPVSLPIFIKLAIPGKDRKSLTSGNAPTYRSEFPDSIHACVSGQTWTAAQLEAVTGGEWLSEPPPGWFVRSVVAGLKHVDMVASPSLFIGHDSYDRHKHEQNTLPVKNFDRHLVIPAHAHRLAGAIVSRREIIKSLPVNFPVLRVSDPIKALIELGIAARQRYRGPVIAVTGTVGKSTTVSLIQALLGGGQRVLASFDNYNSRVGAPATLANLGMDHEAAVVEIAQSALWMSRGPVSRLVRPTIALITEIGLSQTGAGVKTVEDVAKWKSRVFDGLTGSAIAVIGDHLPCFPYVLQQAGQHSKRVVVFGRGENAEVRVESLEPDEEGSWVTLLLPHERVRLRVPLPGPGMVNNVVAAISVIYAMGLDVKSLAPRLLSIEAADGRLQRKTLWIRGRSVQLIDDSFNAEVTSMVNALSILATARVKSGARKIAVLARIVHLGEMARSLHESLRQPVIESGADHVVTHGEEMRFLRNSLPDSVLGPHFSDAEELVRYLIGHIEEGDLILLKGSRRDSDFGKVATLLSAASHEPKISLSPPNRSDSTIQSGIVKEEVECFFCIHWLGSGLAGIERAVLARAGMFIQHLGIIPKILSNRLDPWIQTHWEQYRSLGWVKEQVRLINLYDDVLEIETGSDCPPARLIVPDDCCVEEVSEKTTDQRIKSGDGRLRHYVIWRDRNAGLLDYINHFFNGVKVRRDRFNRHGQLQVSQKLGDQERVLSETCFTPRGRCKIIRHFDPVTGAIKGIEHFSDDGLLDAVFDNEHALTTWWLQRRINTKNNLFFVDRAAKWRPALESLRKHVPQRVFSVLHSFHVEAGQDPMMGAPTIANLTKADGVEARVVLTEQQRNDIAARFPGGCPLVVIPHAVDGEIVETDFDCRDPNLLVAFVRLVEIKRVEHMVEIMAEVVQALPGKRLEIYGQGEARNQIAALIKERGLQNSVHLMGYVTNVGEVLNRATFSLLTSKAEGFCLALLESLAHGCPAFSYDIRYGPSALIDDEKNGLLVTDGDIRQASEVLIRTLGDREKIRLMSKRAYGKARLFNQESVAEKWRELIGSSWIEQYSPDTGSC